VDYVRSCTSDTHFDLCLQCAQDVRNYKMAGEGFEVPQEALLSLEAPVSMDQSLVDSGDGKNPGALRKTHWRAKVQADAVLALPSAARKDDLQQNPDVPKTELGQGLDGSSEGQSMSEGGCPKAEQGEGECQEAGGVEEENLNAAEKGGDFLKDDGGFQEPPKADGKEGECPKDDGGKEERPKADERTAERPACEGGQAECPKNEAGDGPAAELQEAEPDKGRIPSGDVAEAETGVEEEIKPAEDPSSEEVKSTEEAVSKEGLEGSLHGTGGERVTGAAADADGRTAGIQLEGKGGERQGSAAVTVNEPGAVSETEGKEGPGGSLNGNGSTEPQGEVGREVTAALLVEDSGPAPAPLEKGSVEEAVLEGGARLPENSGGTTTAAPLGLVTEVLKTKPGVAKETGLPRRQGRSGKLRELIALADKASHGNQGMGSERPKRGRPRGNAPGLDANPTSPSTSARTRPLRSVSRRSVPKEQPALVVLEDSEEEAEVRTEGDLPPWAPLPGGKIGCPGKEWGGCGKGVLELRTIQGHKWMENLDRGQREIAGVGEGKPPVRLVCRVR
jgi:hypothetical protein